MIEDGVVSGLVLDLPRSDLVDVSDQGVRVSDGAHLRAVDMAFHTEQIYGG